MAPSRKGFNNSQQLLIMSFISSLGGDYFLREKGYRVLLANFELGRKWTFVSYMIEKKFSKVIWLRTPSITYSNTSILLQIWHFRWKYWSINILVKTFCRCIKISLAPRVKKSVLKELAFAKFNNFLNLIKFDFLNLVNFATNDRFSIFPSTSPPVPLSASPGTT